MNKSINNSLLLLKYKIFNRTLQELNISTNILLSKLDTNDRLNFRCFKSVTEIDDNKIEYYEKIKKSLKSGININYHDEKGNTPLYNACNKGHIEIIKLLIKLGANVNHKNNNNELALHIACRKGNIEIIKYLIKKKIKINSRNIKGNTGLHIACMHNNIEVIKLLLDNYIDINIENKDGETAFMYVNNLKKQ